MKWILIIALYIVGWILYGSLVYDFSRKSEKTDEDDTSSAFGCLCGMFWPIVIFLSLIIYCIKRISRYGNETEEKSNQ